MAPALRDDKPTLRSAFKAPDDVGRFYEDHVAEVVRWQLQENSGWFRQRFIEELREPRSVVRINAPSITDESIEAFITTTEDKSTFNRHSVETWAATLEPDDRLVVLSFRELLYHVSGARVVHCEGALPQEEYIDFDLADLSQQRTRLSDDLVFWKIFVEQALGTLQLRALPVELLDILDFNDIKELRQPLLESGFQARYDELTRIAVEVARGPAPAIVEGIEMLEAIRSSLEETFRDVFERELTPFMKRRLRGVSKGLVSNSTSVALGLLGLVPFVGPLASVASLAKDSTALCLNVADFRATPGVLLDRVLKREDAIRKIAGRLPQSNALGLDVVDAITGVMRERMRML